MSMTPIEFQKQYLADVLSDTEIACHPELVNRLCEFILFERETLLAYGIDEAAVGFLVDGGLPADAAPSLSFERYSRQKLEELYDLYDLPRSLFPLGHNGSGDPLGIETSSRAVVYMNHDAQMQRVFVNSSVAQFAESLLLYQRLLKARKVEELLEQLRMIDPAAAVEGTMWHAEANSNPYWD